MCNSSIKSTLKIQLKENNQEHNKINIKSLLTTYSRSIIYKHKIRSPRRLTDLKLSFMLVKKIIRMKNNEIILNLLNIRKFLKIKISMRKSLKNI